MGTVNIRSLIINNKLSDDHGHVAIDYLKINIEQSEWDALPNIIFSGMVSNRGERTRTGHKNYFVDILKKKLSRGNLIVDVCRAYFSLHTQIFS